MTFAAVQQVDLVIPLDGKPLMIDNVFQHLFGLHPEDRISGNNDIINRMFVYVV